MIKKKLQLKSYSFNSTNRLKGITYTDSISIKKNDLDQSH